MDDALRASAGRGLRPGPRSGAGSGRARRRVVFERTRTCADLEGQHGAGLGVLARPSGQARCHAAAHLAINPAAFPADAPRVSRRFAGSRRPRIAAPQWGVFMTARASLAEFSVPEGAESMNRFQRATRATVGGRQPDEPAAMSLHGNDAMPRPGHVEQVQRCGTALRRQGDHGCGLHPSRTEHLSDKWMGRHLEAQVTWLLLRQPMMELNQEGLREVEYLRSSHIK